VTVKGQIDQRTGMLVDLGALNEAIEEFVIKPFDHSFLNKDIAFFAEVVPTAENIALYISNVMRSPVQSIGATLHKIKLIESPNNSCEIYCTDSEVGNVGNTANQAVLAAV
jgi:6-pyruvoyltetrahydropterin/6-carboxytetrahydropterin synthase